MNFEVCFLTYQRYGSLIFKLKHGISGKLLRLSKDFLSDRKKYVFLNVPHFSWMNVQAGVLQGSILGPLLFLICFNDLPDNLTSNPNLLADTTSPNRVMHFLTSKCAADI